MNYRHGYHAGNHTEVFKHSALIALVEILKRKDKPFVVIDTHAGVGIHDLNSEMAERTGEANGGIRKMMGSGEVALRPYLDLVREVGGPEPAVYPGSPEIVRRLLRSDDRLVACELHRVDIEALRANLGGDPRVAVHHRDGYEAALALIPPKGRRGLVFIDPPFEKPDEADALARCLIAGHAKWPTGVFVGWFPIKNHRIARGLVQSLQAARVAKSSLATFVPYRMDDDLLAGSGLAIINPPWTLEERLEEICRALGRTYQGARWTLARITEEDGSRSVNPIA